MSVNYRRCYEILQLEPGATWEELRKQYKHLVQRYHPDRYHDDPDALKEAEANLLALNTSYRVLEEYYKRNMRLPLGKASPHADWHFQNTTKLKEQEDFQSERRRPIRNLPVSQWAVFAMPASVVLLAIAFLAAYSEGEHEIKTTSSESVAKRDVDANPSESVQAKYFGYGAPRKKVLDIQGKPTSMLKNIWFYGKSRVDFENGHVVGWKQHKNNPLHVRGEAPGGARSSKRLIQLGSTKDDVLGIQGMPLIKTERRWEYGPSFIEFKNGRVVRWHSSVLRPLAVAKSDARKD